MNPSSPSNADSPAGVSFKVSTRALTADLRAARADESSRELGSIDAASLLALLEKLSALESNEVHEADPQIIATGRRGRFSIRPVRGHYLLRSVTDVGQSYIELIAADVPTFLDGREVQPATPTDAPLEAPAARSSPPKRTVALVLFALSGLAIAFSAWLTFRPDEVDPESDYEVVSATAEIAALRAKVTGIFVSGSADDERSLEFSPDGSVRYREYGPDREIADDRMGASAVARRRADQAVVLRVQNLGTIEVKAPDTVVFARDAYHRKPRGGSSAP